MAYEIQREDGFFMFNVYNFEGQLIDHDRFFSNRDDAVFVAETLYPGIKELGEL
ncbi:hypothetical protein [Caulobacter phage Cr30]|uniref:hypothetical protein n=1 Tax=Caulobacter phage Cr30 TaxID=1357714 RepID=UPI0004A9B690|nr:hypothetical protein OZ74_gp142 [Caulobacter phage Cr30]AGS81027.1 hypothetical protein [Caulobacter phage Cr30]